ncbi:ADP-forming succinate--CoA ligase subunit beta [Candidatus Uabimicrobium amorphum]|uniref:Succinate--CoA ligase [ADP-forming] subunit beta n=1 Tax=Uabimicrobium amorphum TaxID=2596890 RepID=A0A5S9IHV7_UABAM|nr:ADP-forming succinate--CoA ligase subunit beta [Candidatus Uabimicrobium amorphum]BBM81944.1 succinate--CoA ligase [ADP-forming] subunit beta [Candidatus Uabimicrobium amorphum]
MNIHEYQAKEILAKFNVPVQQGVVVNNGDEAAGAYETLGSELAVVKAQVHAGGRGKGGGVKLVRSAQEAKEVAETILSKPLVTPQTTAEGVPVHKLLVCPGADIEKEYYVGMVVDRALGPVIMASTEGGIEIEEVAKNTPEKILKEPVDPGLGLQAFQARRLAFGLGFGKDQLGVVCQIMQGLAKAFLETDCALMEINPLITTKTGEVLALDAKIGFDDNASFRHPMYAELHDSTQENETELKAAELHLSYVKLDGNIGCMVNGAGLAMATMDIIKQAGGEPANFLDVGGGVSEKRVTEAFKIILSDPNVEAVLVNIFGGIVQCDVVAQGVIEAVKAVQLSVPLVVRLEGTNVEKGRQIFADSDLPIITATGMLEAANKVVEAAKGGAS